MPNSIRFGRLAATSRLSRTTGLPPITGFTMMAWAQVVVSRSAIIFDLGTSSAGSFYGCGPWAGTFQIYKGGFSNSGIAITTGQWNHMALTVSGSGGSGSVIGYLNGVNVVSTTPATFVATHLDLGDDGAGDYFNGRLAGIKIYNRVLDAGQIAAEMPYALPVDWAGLNAAHPIAGAWDLVDSQAIPPRGATTRWSDYSGNGNEYSSTGTMDTDIGPPIRWAPPRSLYANRRRPFAPSAAPASRRRIVLIG